MMFPGNLASDRPLYSANCLHLLGLKWFGLGSTTTSSLTSIPPRKWQQVNGEKKSQGQLVHKCADVCLHKVAVSRRDYVAQFQICPTPKERIYSADMSLE